MKELNLKVTVANGDLIIAGLAELPYKVSALLIEDLRKQATEQITPKIDERKYDDIANKKLAETEKAE